MDESQVRDLFGFYGQVSPVLLAPLVQRAFAIAERAHRGQFRRSGDPYLVHALETARVLAELGADEEAVAAGLLHDVLDDTATTAEDLRVEMPSAVVDMVECVSRVSGLSQLGRSQLGDMDAGSVDNLRNLLLSIADERVLVVKLSDRLHNMRTLHALPQPKQRRFADETMRVYVPLANRLGLWSVKAELEDLAFSYLDPAGYQRVQGLVRSFAKTEAVQSSLDILKESLDREGVRYIELSGRPKSLYGIYCKMQDRGETGLEAVYDARGIRIIVDRKEDCFAMLRRVHALWAPVPDRFKARRRALTALLPNPRWTRGW